MPWLRNSSATERRRPREEVGQFNGAYKVTEACWPVWPNRIVEQRRSARPAFIGMGIGASMLGVRPVMELMFWSFYSVAFDRS